MRHNRLKDFQGLEKNICIKHIKTYTKMMLFEVSKTHIKTSGGDTYLSGFPAASLILDYVRGVHQRA